MRARLAVVVSMVCGCVQVWAASPLLPGHQGKGTRGAGSGRGGEVPAPYASSVVRVKRKAIDSTQLWPDAVVPYTFLSPEPERGVVLEGLAHWERHTCMRFLPVNDTELPHLQFRKLLGCRSGVGIESSSGQNISIGDNCNKVGIVVHEVGHAVGLYHEIRRPDRDQHVVVNEDNILKEELFNFFKLHWLDVSIEYDLSSVMHYHTLEWSSNKRTTVATRDPMLQGLLGMWKVEHDPGLSHRDRLLVNKIYGCLDQWLTDCNLNRNPCKNEGYLGSSCTCVCPPGTHGRICQNVTAGYYDHLKSPCSVEVTNPTTITSPNYPSNYDGATWCVYRVKAPECHSPQVVIQDFQLGPRDQRDYCFHDYLEVRNHSLYDGFLVCGSEVKQGTTWTSTTNTMILYFKGDEGGYRGFKGYVKFQPILGCCRTYSNTSGAFVLHTPRYPNPYVGTFNCSYTLPQEAPAMVEVRVVRQGGDGTAPPWTCSLILCQPQGRCRRHCPKLRKKTPARRSRGGGKRRKDIMKTNEVKRWRKKRGRRSYNEHRGRQNVRRRMNEENEAVREEEEDGREVWKVVLPNVASPHLLQYLGPSSPFRSEGAAYQVTFTLKESPCHQILFVNRSDSLGWVQVGREAEGMLLQCEWWIQAPRGSHVRITVESLSLPADDEDAYLAVNEAGDVSYPEDTTRVYQGAAGGQKVQVWPPPLVSQDDKMCVVFQGPARVSTLIFKYELYDCDDSNAECSYWAADGECNLNPAWMRQHCRQSCFSCDYTSVCEDNHKDCHFWAEHSQCNENSIWMAVHCRLSCGHCEKCQDAGLGCGRWAERGECGRNPSYMARFCRKSCHFCEKEVTLNATAVDTTTTTLTTIDRTKTSITPKRRTSISTPLTSTKLFTTTKPPMDTTTTTTSPRRHKTPLHHLPSNAPSGWRKPTGRYDEENETTRGIKIGHTFKSRKYKRKFNVKTPRPWPHARKVQRHQDGRVNSRRETSKNANIIAENNNPTHPVRPETSQPSKQVNVLTQNELSYKKSTPFNNNDDAPSITSSLKNTRQPPINPISLTPTTSKKGTSTLLVERTHASGVAEEVTTPRPEGWMKPTVPEEEEEDEGRPPPAQASLAGTNVTSGSPDVHNEVTPADRKNKDRGTRRNEGERRTTTGTLKHEYISHGLNKGQNSLVYVDQEDCDGEGRGRGGGGGRCGSSSPNWRTTTSNNMDFIKVFIRSQRRENSTLTVLEDNDVTITTDNGGRRQTGNGSRNTQVHRRRKHRRNKGKSSHQRSGKRRKTHNQQHGKYRRSKHIRRRGRWRSTTMKLERGATKGGRGDARRPPNKGGSHQEGGREHRRERGGKRRERHRLREHKKRDRSRSRIGSKRKSETRWKEYGRRWRAERRDRRRGRGNQRRNNSTRRHNHHHYERTPTQSPILILTTTTTTTTITTQHSHNTPRPPSTVLHNTLSPVTVGNKVTEGGRTPVAGATSRHKQREAEEKVEEEEEEEEKARDEQEVEEEEDRLAAPTSQQHHDRHTSVSFNSVNPFHPTIIFPKHKKPPTHHSEDGRRGRRTRKQKRGKQKARRGRNDEKRRRSETRPRHGARLTNSKNPRPSPNREPHQNGSRRQSSDHTRPSLATKPDIDDATLGTTRHREAKSTPPDDHIVGASNIAVTRSERHPHGVPTTHSSPARRQMTSTSVAETQTQESTDTKVSRSHDVLAGKYVRQPDKLTRIQTIPETLESSGEWRDNEVEDEMGTKGQVASPRRPVEKYAEWGIGPLKPS